MKAQISPKFFYGAIALVVVVAALFFLLPSFQGNAKTPQALGIGDPVEPGKSPDDIGKGK